MKTIQPTLRYRENTERVVISEIVFDCKWYPLDIVQGFDGFRFHFGFVETLLEEWHVVVGVADDFA